LRWCRFGGVTVWIWWCEFGKEKVLRREKWELLSWSGSDVVVECLGRNERNETLCHKFTTHVKWEKWLNFFLIFFYCFRRFEPSVCEQVL
jgi:hypothetical protein